MGGQGYYIPINSNYLKICVTSKRNHRYFNPVLEFQNPVRRFHDLKNLEETITRPSVQLSRTATVIKISSIAT